MIDYDEIIEDLTDLVNGDLDSWDEKPTAQRAITLLKHYRAGLINLAKSPQGFDGYWKDYASKTLEGTKDE